MPPNRLHFAVVFSAAPQQISEWCFGLFGLAPRTPLPAFSLSFVAFGTLAPVFRRGKTYFSPIAKTGNAFNMEVSHFLREYAHNLAQEAWRRLSVLGARSQARGRYGEGKGIRSGLTRFLVEISR